MIGLNVCLYKHSVNLNNHVLVLKDMLNNKIKRGYKDLETILIQFMNILKEVCLTIGFLKRK